MRIKTNSELQNKLFRILIDINPDFETSEQAQFEINEIVRQYCEKQKEICANEAYVIQVTKYDECTEEYFDGFEVNEDSILDSPNAIDYE